MTNLSVVRTLEKKFENITNLITFSSQRYRKVVRIAGKEFRNKLFLNGFISKDVFIFFLI